MINKIYFTGNLLYVKPLLVFPVSGLIYNNSESLLLAMNSHAYIYSIYRQYILKKEENNLPLKTASYIVPWIL